jgi:hypothetical protein
LAPEIELDAASRRSRADRWCPARRWHRSPRDACRRGIAAGPGSAPALSGPTVTRFRHRAARSSRRPRRSRPSRSPGSRTGRPDPLRKRAARSTSNSRAVCGL